MRVRAYEYQVAMFFSSSAWVRPVGVCNFGAITSASTLTLLKFAPEPEPSRFNFAVHVPAAGRGEVMVHVSPALPLLDVQTRTPSVL